MDGGMERHCRRRGAAFACSGPVVVVIRWKSHGLISIFDGYGNNTAACRFWPRSLGVNAFSPLVFPRAYEGLIIYEGTRMRARRYFQGYVGETVPRDTDTSEGTADEASPSFRRNYLLFRYLCTAPHL